MNKRIVPSSNQILELVHGLNSPDRFDLSTHVCSVYVVIIHKNTGIDKREEQTRGELCIVYCAGSAMSMPSMTLHVEYSIA